MGEGGQPGCGLGVVTSGGHTDVGVGEYGFEGCEVVEVTVEYEIGVVSGGLGQPELELFGAETIDGEDEGGGYLGFGVWGDVAHNPFV